MGDRERFISLLKSTNRKGMDVLIKKMEIGGFFSAPCSTRYHLSQKGGLLKHSLNVYDVAVTLKKALNSRVSDDSIIICALLHDLGKMGDFGKANYVENILKSGKQSAIPYEVNKELTYLPHEIRSVIIAERSVSLTEDEEHAIVNHNGLYGAMADEIKGHETELYMIIHTADMWASRFLEK